MFKKITVVEYVKGKRTATINYSLKQGIKAATYDEAQKHVSRILAGRAFESSYTVEWERDGVAEGYWVGSK